MSKKRESLLTKGYNEDMVWQRLYMSKKRESLLTNGYNEDKMWQRLYMSKKRESVLTRACNEDKLEKAFSQVSRYIDWKLLERLVRQLKLSKCQP